MNKAVVENAGARISIVRPLFALLAVLVISLALLVYVAYTDVFRSYRVFLLDRVHSNGEIIQSTIEPLLQAGLPIDQLVGLNAITQPILDSDSAIAEISIVDRDEQALFTNVQRGIVVEYDVEGEKNLLVENDISYEVYELDTVYQVRLPLESRFEQPGELRLTIKNEVIVQEIYPYMRLIAVVAVVIVILYMFVLRRVMRSHKATNVSLNIIYNVAFLVVAVFLVINLIQIYSEGLQAKTRALANSLTSRLDSAFELGLDITDFDGIDETFIEYKSLNPDIQYVSLNRNGTVVSHTDPESIGGEYTLPSGVIEYKRQIGDEYQVEIAVAIPSRFIYLRLLRNIKNFAVLLLASAFLAWIFLRLLLSINNDLRSVVHRGRDQTLGSRSILDLIFPAFFLANFIEGLHYSYLPQYLRQIALDSGFAAGNEAILFSVFWACYTLTLIPAGRFARKIEGIRTLLTIGFGCVAVSMVMLAAADSFVLMYAVRALAGIGQGMIFIAVQSYILQSAKSDQLTEGVTIIVYGYNGGVISGTVIGALLVESLGTSTLFSFSAVVAIMLLWYSVQVIGGKRVRSAFSPADPQSRGVVVPQNVRDTVAKFGSSGVAVSKKFWKNVGSLFKDIEFAKAILCVGLIAKAVLAGVVFLALPQLLSGLNYRQEDIGQILMFYAVGVLLVSRVVARHADRVGKTRTILFTGSIVSGISLCIMAATGLLSAYFALQTLLIITGVLMLGLSHGFIHAPIVTHISHSPASRTLGRSVVASIYRFLERTGHIMGPLILGQLLLARGSNITSLAYVGFVAIGFAIIFIVLPSRQESHR